MRIRRRGQSNTGGAVGWRWGITVLLAVLALSTAASATSVSRVPEQPPIQTRSPAPESVLLYPTVLPSPTPAPQTAPPSPAATPPPRAQSTAPAGAPIRCTGPALTSQAEIQPNASFCGGAVHSQVTLAAGDTWTLGEVSGASTGSQQGAVQCASSCTLVSMNIHDNPNAFAGIYLSSGTVTITGGRVANSGSLGIGGSQADPLTVSRVEIDHNGGSADCGFEGGGFKGVNRHLRFTNNNVHDNNCPGVWLDVSAGYGGTVELDHNRIGNNAHEGIFYEISFNAVIHDNVISGNGFQTNGSGCDWLWGGGITIASSFNAQVYGNALRGNCNGITGTQQNRSDNSPAPHLLENLSIHNNSIVGPGRTGVVQDNGADLSTRNILFANNAFAGGATFCALSC